MKAMLSTVARSIEQLNEWVGKIVIWFSVVLVLLIGYDVFMRYVFSKTSAAITDLQWYLFSMIFLLGSAYALKHDEHVRVDVFYGGFSEKGKSWVNLLGSLFMLLPFCMVMLKYSVEFTYFSFNINEGSPEPGGLPARYLIKSALVIGFTLLILQAIAMICRSLLCIVWNVVPPKEKKKETDLAQEITDEK